MADSTRKPKNWVKGSAKGKDFPEGGQIINLDLHYKDLGRLPQNEAGYVKITLSRLREPDKYGNEFQIYENEWKPDPNKAKKGAIGKPVTKAKAEDDSDLPF